MALPTWLANVPTPPQDTADRLRTATSNWLKLNMAVMGMTLVEVQQLLVLEINGPCRPFVVHRLMTRIARLRSDCERADLLSALPAPVANEVRRLQAARTLYRSTKS